ncbi:MAG TPA: hypothetical protein VOA64_19520 [Candidatus Dormibacteraeota bacterium]|nr:hypothetical protein [Candidatus Dormibacteraeota bacterium]
MKYRPFAIILSLALIAVCAFAHGDKKHIMGTLEKINGDSVIVKTSGGKSVEVKLLESTVYISRNADNDQPAKRSDLAVGDRVVIHATPKGDTLEADQIKFSIPNRTHGNSMPTPKSRL